MKYIVKNEDGELTFDSLTHLRVMYQQGMVEPTDRVRAEDSEIWRQAGAIPELRDAISTQRADSSVAMGIMAAFGCLGALIALVKFHSMLGALVCMVPVLALAQRAFISATRKRRD